MLYDMSKVVGPGLGGHESGPQILYVAIGDVVPMLQSFIRTADVTWLASFKFCAVCFILIAPVSSKHCNPERLEKLIGRVFI